jgi:putative acetyltransferase
MQVRLERPTDVDSIRTVLTAAFGRTNESNLVDQLRSIAHTVSLVAVTAEQRMVGHIFFSPVSVEGTCPQTIQMLGVGPLAVHPDYQRQGVGTLLLGHGLETCRERGYSAVVVLGDPAYYSRVQFTPAKRKGLRCEYLVPDEAFMALELKEGALKGCCGLVKYQPEFSQCEP